MYKRQALLRAHGDAKRPLYALAAAVVVNFVLDLAFVRLFGWGTAGIGIATVVNESLFDYDTACLLYTSRCV